MIKLKYEDHIYNGWLIATKGEIQMGVLWVVGIILLAAIVYVIAKRIFKSKKTISFVTLLSIVFSGVGLALNFNNVYHNDNVLKNVAETIGANKEISNEEFAEEFCKKIKAVLLAPGDEQIKKVRAMLNELKEKNRERADLEERYIYTLSKCGQLCCDLGYVYDASVFTEEALVYAKELEVSADNFGFVGFCYVNRAAVLIKQNQRLEAEECYLNALHLFEQQGVSISKELAVLYTNLADFYNEDAEYAEALTYQEKALEIWKGLGRTNSIDMGVGHIMMARICRYVDQKREFSELIAAKSILENNKPESNEYLMKLYGDLGGYYWSSDKIKSEEYFNQARALGLQLEGELSNSVINAEIGLAYIYSEYGEVQKALEILESAVMKCEKVYGETGVGTAYAYTELAGVYIELQEYVKSVQYYEKAQSIYENVYGSIHPDIAYVLGNKANAFMRLGQDLKAIECVDRAIYILESNRNTARSNMAELLKKKAEFIVMTQGELGEAIQLLEDAKLIYKELYGENNERVLGIDLQMGQAYVRMESSDSYKILDYVVQRYKELYGEDSYKMIEVYMILGECLYQGLGEESENKQMERARECYSKAAGILKLFNCTNSVSGIKCYERLGMSSYNLEDFENTIKYYEKAQDICFILQQEDSLDHRWLWARMARVYAYIGDDERAREYLVYVEKFMDDIVNEDEQLNIYTDMLGTCILLGENEKRIKYARFLEKIITEDNVPPHIREWIYKNLN